MIRRLLLGIWSALLPASEREPLVARLDVDLPTIPVSWALAVAQLSLIPVWALMGVSYAHDVTSVQAEIILGTDVPPSFAEAMLASVALGPFAFLFSPQGLLLEYVIVTGTIRIAGLVASDRPTGDPIVTLLAWLTRVGGDEARRRRRLRALGPWRPDRIFEDGQGLLVLSAEDKRHWDERVTFEYRGAFYRLAQREDRPYDRWVDAAYALRPRQPGELIRTVVQLDGVTDPGRSDRAAKP